MLRRLYIDLVEIYYITWPEKLSRKNTHKLLGYNYQSSEWYKELRTGYLIKIILILRKKNRKKDLKEKKTSYKI